MTVRTVALGATGIETTVLGLGCADLFRVPGGRRGRRALLDAAYDAGIRHFDAAPMYGLGVVERELGAFARARRDGLVLATKFGVSPTPAGRILAPVQAPLQRLAAGRSGGGDPRSGAAGGLLYRTGDYGPDDARASLERSLHALGTDHVDLLFLHDPPPGTVVGDELRAFLESVLAAGLVGAWGVAGEHAHAHADVPVLQVRGDRPTVPGRATIRFGVIGGPLRRILSYLDDDGRRRRWSEVLGSDCSRPETIAALLLRTALAADPTSPVLFGTTRPERVGAAAAAAVQPADEALAAFRSLLREVET